MTAKLTDLISRAPWREAVTYRDTWPHEYVLSIRDGQRELQDAIYARFLNGEGVDCRFFRVSNKYLFISDFKYWFNNKWEGFDPNDDNVINRARLYRDRRDFVIQPGDTGKPEDYPTNPAHQNPIQDLTKPQEATLLSFIAQRHTIGLEDVATDALYFILSRSDAAGKALSELMGDEHGPLPIAKAQPWATDARGAIPDLACLDDDDNLVALIESKFWASLTHNQPVTYWQGLPTHKSAVLLFLAPDYRVDQGDLWDELVSRLRDAGHELGPADRRPGLITAQSRSDQRRLMLTTWQLLLDRMAKRAGEDGDTQACFEIAELQGLAASAIKGDRPTRDENLKQLIAESVKRLEQSKWADASGLAVGQGADFHGRYLRLAGALAWLGIDSRAVKETGKPLWLHFYEEGALRIKVNLEQVRSRLEGRLETKLTWRSDDEVYLPVELPRGADREKTLNAIVAQLERIARLIDPEGPTYR